MPRLPVALIPYLAAFALIVGGYLWYAGDVTSGLAHQRPVNLGGPFTLVDQYGHSRTDEDFRGRFMLIYFGYSMCPDVCPTELGKMADAIAELGPRAKRVVPVFITVDPQRDTPPHLKDYVSEFGSQFVGLTGTLDQIKSVAKEYNVYFRKRPLGDGNYGMDHTSTIYLIGPNGKLANVYTEGTNPDDIANDLKKRL